MPRLPRLSASFQQVSHQLRQRSLAWVPVRALALVLAAALTFGPIHNADAQTPATPTAATGRQRVLILRTETAAVPDGARQAIAKEIYGQALRYKQLDIVMSAADLVEEMFEFECTEAGVECLGRIGNKYGAQLVVFSEVVKTSSGGLALNMRVIDVQALRVAQSTAQPLEADKAQPAIVRGLVVLLGPVEMTSNEAPGRLHVALLGGGPALVYVDDQLAGNTEDKEDIAIPAGSHVVRVVRAGFRDWSGRVTVPAGGRIDKTVHLEQLTTVVGQGPSKAVDTPITHKWWFWTLIGVGIAGGAAVAIVAASSTTPVVTGAASFTLDSNNAHLDPVFGPAATK